MATTRIATVAFDLPQTVDSDKRYDAYIALIDTERLFSSDMDKTPLPETTRWTRMRPGDTCQALADRIKATILRVTGYEPTRLFVCDGNDMVTFAQPEKGLVETFLIGGHYADQLQPPEPYYGLGLLADPTPVAPHSYGALLNGLLKR